MSICWLGTSACHSPGRVGGKAANLSRLAASQPVPPGYALSALSAGRDSLTPALRAEIARAYQQLGERCGLSNPPVAVRSSAVDEDGRQASFAGQHESYLNVVGSQAVESAVQACLDSFYSDRAMHYRRSHKLSMRPAVAVLVQQFIMADVSAVVFSADPCTGDRSHILINAVWGLGESLVSGMVTPDLYIVHKDRLELRSVQVASKECMTVACAQGTRQVALPRAMCNEPVLNHEQIYSLARLALTLEKRQGWAVDLECAFQRHQFFLLQCRSVTTLPQPAHSLANCAAFSCAASSVPAYLAGT